jgi:hypothetical protein
MSDDVTSNLAHSSLAPRKNRLPLCAPSRKPVCLISVYTHSFRLSIITVGIYVADSLREAEAKKAAAK